MFYDAAAFYVGLGWKIFPLAALSKVPAIKGAHGFKDATDDADIITRWALKFPDANIGIATGAMSEILVVDVDPRNGGDATIAKLAANGLILGRPPEARTGNGGRHLFFAYAAQIKPSKNRLGPGIDIKTDGGYVVGAPSCIAASEQGPGGSYVWVRQPTGGLPLLPKWAHDRLIPQMRTPMRAFATQMTSDIAERNLEGMARTLAQSSEGSRNSILNWGAFHAGGLVKSGKISADRVRSRLISAALSAGLPLQEAQATVESGIKGAFKE